MAGTSGTATRSATWSPIQLAAGAAGAVFLLVGLLGFIPGFTTNFDQLELAGPDSGALLLGIFAVSVLHNIVHLAFGVAGLEMARIAPSARTFLIGGGVIYLGLWIYGVLVAKAAEVNFMPVNTADNWLHLGLAMGMIALGQLPATARPEFR